MRTSTLGGGLFLLGVAAVFGWSWTDTAVPEARAGAGETSKTSGPGALPTTPSPTAATVPEAAPSTGAWRVKDTTDLLDGAREYIAYLPSETTVRNSIGLQEEARLYLRCEGGRFDVFVAWPSMVGLEPVPVRYRIGSSPVISATWGNSTSGTAAFVLNPAQFAAMLRGQAELVVGMSAWGETEQSALFTLTGIEPVLTDLAGSCPSAGI